MTITARPARVLAGPRTADDGLFGPSSITWKLHAHPSMMLVGIVAATTQMLHPRVMRMIDQASSFREHPEKRGRQTGLYMLTITYGDVETAEGAGATLRRIHQAVKATDPATGTVYDAEEPDLLIWVQNALTYSGIRVFDEYASDLLTDDVRDQYVLEQQRAGELIGMDRADLPSTFAELEGYIKGMLPSLATIPEALWFRDTMMSRHVEGIPQPKGAERFFSRLIKDQSLMLMLPEHRSLFGIDLPASRRLAARVGTRMLLKAATSKVPNNVAIRNMREAVDVQAFGGRRRRRAPDATDSSARPAHDA